MYKIFRKFFIPHKHNRYHPHLFRKVSLFSIFALGSFLLGVSYGNYLFLRQTVMGANIAVNVLIDLANENRIAHGVVPLEKNDRLESAAKMKAEDMIQNKYFAHFSPDGTTPWYFMNKAGYDFIYAGENLAINFTNPESVDNAWMNSELHRANLLNTNFKEVGIASIPGKYKDTESVYVVQMFGTRAQSKNEHTEPVKVIEESKSFLAVKKQVLENASEVDNVVGVKVNEDGKVLGVKEYASIFDRFIFNAPFYIQYFYLFAILVLTVGIVFRMFIEYRRQHIKHLIISGVFLLLMLILAVLNTNFINY